MIRSTRLVTGREPCETRWSPRPPQNGTMACWARTASFGPRACSSGSIISNRPTAGRSAWCGPPRANSSPIPGASPSAASTAKRWASAASPCPTRAGSSRTARPSTRPATPTCRRRWNWWKARATSWSTSPCRRASPAWPRSAPGGPRTSAPVTAAPNIPRPTPTTTASSTPTSRWGGCGSASRRRPARSRAWRSCPGRGWSRGGPTCPSCSTKSSARPRSTAPPSRPSRPWSGSCRASCRTVPRPSRCASPTRRCGARPRSPTSCCSSR